MTYAAKIIADSIAYGVRLTTMEVCFPRFILAEFNTHRVFSRNSASSRAIPVERRIEQVRANPFIPESFGKNKSGMQADDVLAETEQMHARHDWLYASRQACRRAEELAELGVHKQHANRLIELWSWHTVVVTATEWANFFALRVHPAAQPEMQITARLMKEVYEASTPRELKPGAWHLPYVDAVDCCYGMVSAGHHSADCFDRTAEPASVAPNTLVKVSVARCAAVSFERQNAEKSIEQYVERHDGMLKAGHMSPFEHQAQVVESLGRAIERLDPPIHPLFKSETPSHDGPYAPPFSLRWKAAQGHLEEARDGLRLASSVSWEFDGYFCGNFRAPWLQYRKTLPGETVFSG